MTSPAKIDSARTGFFGYFVRHRTIANLLLVMLLVAGMAAGLNLRTQFFPDVVVERVYVSIVWEGAGASDIDNAVVSRIEPALRGLDGVEAVFVTSSRNQARFSLEFAPGWDMALAFDDVKIAVDEVENLPDSIEPAVVRRAGFSDLVTDVVITGGVSLEVLKDHADDLTTALFREGISRTEIRGISNPRIRIDIPLESLQRNSLSLQAVGAAIKSETGTSAVGEIDAGSARVTMDSSRNELSSIANIPVRTQSDGTRILVSDIAQVYEEGLDRGRAIYHGSDPALVIRVMRDAQGDAIAIQSRVEEVVETISQGLPSGVTMHMAHTRSEAINARIDILLRNGGLGLVIVLGLLFLFLSSRTAFWVAMGIPVALAATVALMYLLGLTFNMISLFALIISLGIIVDDAIVVGEHANHLHHHGMSPEAAAIAAAKRMSAPVFAASITTVIAFLSLTFIHGRFGDLIRDLPFTVGVVVIASLVECFFILPAHMRHALTQGGSRSWLDRPSIKINRGFERFREGVFRPVIRKTMAYRYPLLAASFGLLLFSTAAVIDNTVRWQFFSSPERGTIRANISMLPGATREDTLEMLKEMDRAMNAVAVRLEEEHGTNPLIMMLSTVGGTVGRGFHGAGSRDANLIGGVEIELIDPDLRPYSASFVIGEWRDEIKSHSLLDELMLRRGRSGPAGDDISVRLTGADSETLKAAAEAVKTSLSQFEQVSALEDSLVYDKPEYSLGLKPRGEALGFTSSQLAFLLRQQLQGEVARTLVRDSQDIEVLVSLPDTETGQDYLRQTQIELPDKSGYVPLGLVASITEEQGFASITREAGERVVTITGELSEDSDQGNAVQSTLTQEILPAVALDFGVNYELGGLKEQERDFLRDALSGFGLCLISIYLVLAWIFGSWTRPLAIMLIIPLGPIGAIWGHYWHGIPLSMFSVIGLIGMSGIIINDAIVLISTIDHRAKVQGIREAVIDGTCDRLRAVILTTLTTVGGLALCDNIVYF